MADQIDPQDVDLENNDDTSTEDTETEEVEDSKDEKSETESQKSEREIQLEADLAKWKRIAKQRGKKEAAPAPSKTGDLDYGQKAFLIAQGIKGPDEVKLVTDAMQATGKSLDDVLENPYFKSELEKHRQLKAADDATPKGGKRGGQVSAKDTVEYWIEKGELPPKDQVELRRKVVNAKAANNGKSGPFYDAK